MAKLRPIRWGEKMTKFKWLNDAWYVAMYSDALKAGDIVPRVMLNQGIALYRKADGVVVALEDRCPHRNAPLSLGKVCGDDRIACAYHGLEFDETGKCVFNPHGEGRIPAAARVRAYPVEEKYGMIWVWMGDLGNIAPTPVIDFLEPGTGYVHSKPNVIKMNTPWELIIDNLVDLSHVSFLHDGVLGSRDMIGAKNELVQTGNTIVVSRIMPNVSPPEYADLLYHGDQKPVDKWHTVTWMPPTIILLDIGLTDRGAERSQGTGVYAAHLITPETEESSYYHFLAVRWNLVQRSPEEHERIEKRLAEARVHAFANQDDPMMRAQYEVMKRYGGELKPVMLDIDVGVARWRRIIEKLATAQQNDAAAMA